MNRVILPLVVALGMACDCNGHEPGDSSTVTELSTRYKAASTELQRRAICLEAIDRGTLGRRCPIERVDLIFGTHFRDDIPMPGKSFVKRAVYFADLPPSPDNVAAVMMGWYFVVVFDSEGLVQDYFLSNAHK